MNTDSPTWHVEYFQNKTRENPVKDFIDSLSRQQKDKIFRIFSYIEMYGLISVLPHVKKLSGTPFWEIRILGKDNIRVIYIVPSKQTVLVLHAFVKKKQKTPLKELQTVLNRYKEWLLTR